MVSNKVLRYQNKNQNLNELGDPNDFTIKVGIGKFIQNLAVMAAEAILLSSLFLVVDIPEMIWTEHVEKGMIEKINTMII